MEVLLMPAAKVREHYSNMQFVTSDGNVRKVISPTKQPK